MIALLCPTRGRQEQYQRMVDSVNATAETKIVIMGASNGTDEYVNIRYPTDSPTVYMWNELAKLAMAKEKITHFMLAADDMLFATPGWDTAILDHYQALENKIQVYHLQDSRDPDGTPHPIVTREYITAMGYFLPPLFLHWYVDTWTREIAKANNCFAHLKDYLLIHDKPNDRKQPDATHWHIRKMGWLNRDIEVDKSCGLFLEIEKSRLGASIEACKQGLKIMDITVSNLGLNKISVN